MEKREPESADANRKRSYTWDDFVNIASRLDSTINFTLIRFLYKVLQLKLNNNEIILVTATMLIFINTCLVGNIFLHIKVILALVVSLSSGLLAQALINVATSNEVLLSMQVTNTSRLVEQFTVTTIMLLFAATIPQKFQDKEYVARAITILLYMYTDATQNIIDQLNFGWSPPFLCILISMLLQRHAEYLQRHFTLQYIVKALNMISINVLLTSVSTIDTNATDLHTSTALLILLLFAIDAVMHFSAHFHESRNYAIWKGAQQLFLVYAEFEIATVISFVLAVMFILMHTTSIKLVEYLHLRNNTILEIFLLLVVNVIIDELQREVLSVFNFEHAFVLILYVVSIHTFSLIFKRSK